MFSPASRTHKIAFQRAYEPNHVVFRCMNDSYLLRNLTLKSGIVANKYRQCKPLDKSSVSENVIDLHNGINSAASASTATARVTDSEIALNPSAAVSVARLGT